MSAEKPNNTHISSLSKDNIKPIVDVKNTTVDALIRYLAIDFYKNDTLKNAAYFQGEILRKVEDPKLFDLNPFNFINSVISTNNKRYKVWIPDLCNIINKEIPSDDTLEGKTIISSLPDFVVTDPDIQDLNPKDLVKVTFHDLNNFRDGVIIEKINKTPTGEGGTPNTPPKPSGGFPDAKPGAPQVDAGMLAEALPPIPPKAESPYIVNFTPDRTRYTDLLVSALREYGFNNTNFIAAVLATIMKETGMTMVEEYGSKGYAKNIPYTRSIFGDRLKNYSDEEVAALALDNVKFYDAVYGYQSGKTGRDFNNTNAGDGWKYRGRGFIGFTGKSNYAASSKILFKDNRLVDNPQLLNQAEYAAKAVAGYMKMRINTTKVKYSDSLTPDEATNMVGSMVAGAYDMEGKARAHPWVLNKDKTIFIDKKGNKMHSNPYRNIYKIRSYFPNFLERASRR